MWQEIELTIPGPGRVDADFGDFVVPTDHPPDDDRAGRPPEPWFLFLASIGTCAASFVEDHLRSEGLSPEGVRLVQRTTLDEATAALEVSIEVRLPDDFPEDHRAGVVAAANACTVKRALEAGPRVRIGIGEAGP
jgi:ribosomal protein S12 methylthiotransferase accessory factor